MSVKIKKNLRKSQVQFREKLRKLRLRQNYGFHIKKTCILKAGKFFFDFSFSYELGPIDTQLPNEYYFKSTVNPERVGC